MAGKRSRAQSGEEDDDDQEPREDNSTPESNSSKRAKTSNGHLNGNGHMGNDGDEEEEEEEEDEEPQPSRRRDKGKGRADAHQPNGGASAAEQDEESEDGFKPGAIRRVKLENFTTYEHAEFFPGPSLNMVLGPNGTGKSSLVCAICLGLGYNTNVLGRASAFGEYVKYGKKTATVEVELQKRPRDPRNWVVTLRIDRETNKRDFLINGSTATIQQVKLLNGKMRIQIDNLCQFLPQDKVAEFAGLSPTDLLVKTLQAAAPPEMLRWMEELKSLFASWRESSKLLETDDSELKKFEARLESLQGDVDKIRERERLTEEVEMFRLGRSLPEYAEARNQYAAGKASFRDVRHQAKALEERFEPSMKAVNAKEQYVNDVKEVVKARQGALREAEAAADHELAQNEVVVNKMTDVRNKMEAMETQYTARKKEFAESRKRVTKLEGEYKNQKAPEFDAAEWNRQIREQEHKLRDNQNERTAIRDKMEAIKQTGDIKVREKNKIEKDIVALNSVQGQLRQHLRNTFPDGDRGLTWLEENKDKFEKEVFGPPMLTCSLKDERYSDLVQSVLQRDDFLCFTTQTANDHKNLSNVLFRDLKLSVSIRSSLASYDSYRNPVPREQLQQLGLDGYATDFIEGPAPVLAMLCGEKRLHATAIGLNNLSDENYQRLEQLESIGAFAAGKNSYRVTRRREYGAGAASTRVRQVGRGQFWTDQPVDSSELTELNRKRAEVKAELAELTKQMAELKAKVTALEGASNDITVRLNELKKQKSDLQREANKWQAMPDKIDAEKRTMHQKEAALRDLQKSRLELARQLDRLTLDQVKVALRHRRSIDGIRSAYHAVVEAQTRLVEAESDYACMKDEVADMKAQLEEAQRQITTLQAELNIKKDHANRCKDRVLVATGKYGENVIIPFIGARTVAEVDAEITTRESQLEAIEAQNPHALREFERLTKDIDRLRSIKAAREEEYAQTASQITEIRSQFEPRLDGLVSQINTAFSYNFEQISCAGQVEVFKDESDFDKWAIQIRVRFRPGETLQILDQHRQSGGERAVSTIFFLMSLQAMAQAPFRVVDEINQGMDPRNERMVHERMVEIACREHTSQYFLITPKLLTDLRYDERMKVHCIASGEHVPSLGERKAAGIEALDFGECVRIQREMAARRAYPTPEPMVERGRK